MDTPFCPYTRNLLEETCKELGHNVHSKGLFYVVCCMINLSTAPLTFKDSVVAAHTHNPSITSEISPIRTLSFLYLFDTFYNHGGHATLLVRCHFGDGNPLSNL